MDIQASFSNGDNVTGSMTLRFDGPEISDADALDMAQAILGSNYATTIFSQNGGTPTLDYVGVTNLSRVVPIPAPPEPEPEAP